jgi:hypothetical protein
MMALKISAGFLLLVAAASGQVQRQQPSVQNPEDTRDISHNTILEQNPR